METTTDGMCTPRTNRNTSKLVYNETFHMMDETRNNTRLHDRTMIHDETTFQPKNMKLSDETKSEDSIDFSKLPSTEILITMQDEDGNEQLLLGLLDSGTSRSLISQAAATKATLQVKTNRQAHAYRTTIGVFRTNEFTTIRKHKIVGLTGRRQLVQMKLQLYNGTLGRYDIIFGRDYLKRYGIDLQFSDSTIRWEDSSMPMHPQGFYTDERLEDVKLYLENPELEELMNGDETGIDESFLQTILESKYEKQDLRSVAEAQQHLTVEQRQRLEEVLRKHERLFDGTLGKWNGVKVDIELKPDAVPFHCKRPMRIPHIHLETLKNETDRLCAIGVLEKTDGYSEWCSPSWCIPKKDGRIRYITDYRMLNKVVIRHPWPMPHISDMTENIGRYTYATCLDLSMGYYHLELSESASNLTTFMLPFGCFKYLRLPMGLNISPDVFQRLMMRLISDLPFVNAYLDDIAIISRGDYEDHLEKVSIVLKRLEKTGLAVNALKSHWATNGPVEYLGFILTPEGIRPQPKKIAAIKSLKAPTNRKQLRRIVGMINYYRYMWKRRSHLLAPLTALLSTKEKFIWTADCQTAFDELKTAITSEVMLTFPDYTKPFHLFTDASDYQIGAVLTQEDRPIAFFSRKLNSAQQKYGVGEKEMLSIVETLKEFRTILYGYPVIIHTDHKNLVYDKNFKTSRIMRWRLAVEEYMPTLTWVPGEKNPIADLLSRHPTESNEHDENFTTGNASQLEFRNINLAREYTVPVNLKEIYEAQLKDPTIQRLLQQAPERLGRIFDNTGEKTGPHQAYTIIDPILKEARILVPQEHRKRLIHWYHHILLHPGEERLYNTIHQHYTWPFMRKNIQEFTKVCHYCQKGKRGLRGYGKVPLKEVETQPWKDLCIDLSGPWTATINGKELEFHALTMIDPFTSWPEIVPIYTKQAPYIRDFILQQWLRRYPRPSRIIFDQGTEFDNAWLYALCKRWNIKPEPITVKNPRANAIIERLHRTLGDMLRCQLVKRHDNDDPVSDLLSAAAYAIRATIHGTTHYTPGQLVFSKDMILRTHIQADMELVRLRRQRAAERNNERENKRRIKYKYKPGDKVLILPNRLDPKLKLNQGPYKVIHYNEANGTLQIRRGNYIEPINIRLVRPYFGRHSGGD
jgi:transposase InsO family protein